MTCLFCCVFCLRCVVFVWAWCLMSLCVACDLLRDAVWCVFVCVVVGAVCLRVLRDVWRDGVWFVFGVGCCLCVLLLNMLV